jgi:DnaJ-class molecular chaperone
MPVSCSTCAGRGKVPCPVCDGTGAARPNKRCRHCRGTRFETCPRCKGNGQDPYGNEDR